MTRIDHIKIPADKNTDLMRGGYHLMFFGIPENIAGNVTLILNFEKSGPIEVTAQMDTMAGHMNH
jgi:copper(I)-binding protein